MCSAWGVTENAYVIWVHGDTVRLCAGRLSASGVQRGYGDEM